MGQPSFPNDPLWRLERLEAEVQELYRRRTRRPPNVRDLQDVNGWGALTGYTLLYDQATGRYKPLIAPPTLRWNQHGAVTVESSDHDPMGGAGRLIKVKGRLTTAGSSTTTALIKEGSTTVATLTWGSGATTATVSPSSVNHAYSEDDYFWLDITAAGTGADGLVVVGWAAA